ncbi:MAG: hypothetical protein R2764_01495 [Bacteroidales bacterium]
MKRAINDINNEEDDPHKGFSFSDYQRKAPKALAAMKANNPEKFKALYKKEYDNEPKI